MVEGQVVCRTRGHLAVTVRGPDRHESTVKKFWPLDLATLTVGDQDVVVPERSDPDCSFSEELSDGEINTWILKVLNHGANLNLGAGPTPLREGVASSRVSLFTWICFDSLRDFISSSCLLPCVGTWGCPHRVTVRQIAQGRVEEGGKPRPQQHYASVGAEGGRLECCPLGGERAGRRYPTKFDSSGEEEEQGEVTQSPQSLPLITHPPFSDITSRQVGTAIGERRLKRTRTGTELMASLPQ
jgi:hypothetical protein